MGISGDFDCLTAWWEHLLNFFPRNNEFVPTSLSEQGSLATLIQISPAYDYMQPFLNPHPDVSAIQ